MQEAYNAGVAVAQKCVARGTHARAEGGVVSGLGMYFIKMIPQNLKPHASGGVGVDLAETFLGILGRHGRMRLELTAYNPHVRCEHPRARTSPRDCLHIYGTMHLSENYEHFVHERRERTDTVVPWTVWPSTFFLLPYPILFI